MLNNLSSSSKIALTYLFFSVLWIYFSDSVTNFIFHDIELIQLVQTLKGWLFVTVSSILLYLLSKRLFSKLQKEKDKAEEAKALLQNIINNAPVRIFWKDRKGVYLGANRPFLEDMGLEKLDDLVGKDDRAFTIEEKKDYMQDDRYVMDNNRKKLNYIETITDKDGNRKVINTSKVPLLDKDKNIIGVIGVFNDITEQVKIENQIKQQELLIQQQSKFASMGEMIGNIAHQWRQPLSIISTSATGIKMQKEMGILKDDFEIEALDVINDNVQYLSKTIDDFRNFLNEGKSKKMVELRKVIEKTLSLVDSRLKNREIEIVLFCDDIVFETFETELIQVLINMINNSVDAFEKVETEKYIFIDAKKVNKDIEIKIKDNAGGITDDIINRVFEANFTTKDSSKGTGLGLYICKEIILKHLYGKLNVENSLFTYKNIKYKGSVFTIQMPISTIK